MIVICSSISFKEFNPHTIFRVSISIPLSALDLLSGSDALHVENNGRLLHLENENAQNFPSGLILDISNFYYELFFLWNKLLFNCRITFVSFW